MVFDLVLVFARKLRSGPPDNERPYLSLNLILANSRASVGLVSSQKANGRKRKRRILGRILRVILTSAQCGRRSRSEESDGLVGRPGPLPVFELRSSSRRRPELLCKSVFIHAGMGCGVICQYISAPQYRGNISDSNLIFVSGLTRVDLIQTL